MSIADFHGEDFKNVPQWIIDEIQPLLKFYIIMVSIIQI